MKNCKVWFKHKDVELLGLIRSIDRNIVSIYVIPNKQNLAGLNNKEIRLKYDELKVRSGFFEGDTVLVAHKTFSLHKNQEGIVVGKKQVAGQDLVAVHYYHDDQVAWLPFEILKLIQNTLKNFIDGRVNTKVNHAELFRLKTLAYGIQFWNQNTGSLSSLDIDPLPHQINLVHHILESGNLNWLIADDVGLGKTIETGMLITALKYREQAKRILLVTPAGLTKQWKDELLYKFSFEDFRIYGDDFNITESREWKMYDHVIASIDRLKSDENKELLAASGHWDLIIFDEAHRLTRSQIGNKYSSSDRYDLASSLRKLTDSMILLTATPHQGKSDQFQSLLMLLHPHLKREIHLLHKHPEILTTMVYRNNKSKVTDLNGKLIFKGKTINPINLSVSDDALVFDHLLQEYLRKSAERSIEIGGKEGRAIGFVIAIYRKLAASSIAAILNALMNRRDRLLSGKKILSVGDDDRFLGETEEYIVNHDIQRFIDNEETLLTVLIDAAHLVKKNDLKLKGFLDQVIQPILYKNNNEKVVIFTEYLTTQRYIQDALIEKYGETSVVLINGSMTHEERALAITAFNHDAQFIISTEAGGEGINLQHKCHILVNFDLPWNPMRLVQRIGRIYRYGQEKQVIVFNVFSEGTADDGIVKLLYEKIDQVVADLGSVSDEFDDALKDDIFGSIADLVDVDNILDKSLLATVSQTEQELENALKEIQNVSEKQQELFSHVAQYDAKALEREFVITLEHVDAFLRGMLFHCNIEIIDETHGGKILKIKLPDDLAINLGYRKRILEITIHRKVKLMKESVEMMDLRHPLMNYFLDLATSYDFGGSTAKFSSLNVEGIAIATAILKWQNLQGTAIHREIITFSLSDAGYYLNPEKFKQWLLEPAITVIDENNLQPKLKYDVYEAVKTVVYSVLDTKKNEYLIPHNFYILSGAWNMHKLEISLV